MRLLKPVWVNHKGKPIFSVDIHPDGTRFATGGQGDDSGKIVIWNVAPVKDVVAEQNESIPKVLCQMDNHMACVNCVRWAHHGRYLASCGDDKLIMIWQCSRSGGVSSTFGSNVVNLEHWRCASTLRGHSGDVLDLAWSPHDAWLASCSIDNSVVIWNAHKFPEQVAVLTGHTSLVKGVAWDPVGKYLASQSDDKSLRIWRTLDWQQDACITEPFEECGGTTHVLRLNWSPDGHYLVSAHAMNNSGPTAQIITRQGWRTDMDFVGHRKAITCVRFNPRIFSKEVKKGSGKKQQFSCCAIGSRDRSLSIWLTALKRPLVVVHDLFTNSVMDSSWSKTGLELICCSWDGTVAYLGLSEEEIGRPLTVDEMNKFHQKLYGKSMAQMNGAGPQIIESTAMLKLQQQQALQKEREDEAKRAAAHNTMTPVKSTTTTPSKGVSFGSPDTPSKQIETRTKDGRRRIQPIFLAPPPDLSDGPAPFVVGTNFTSTTDRSSIVVEKKDGLTEDPEANMALAPAEEASIQPMSALESTQPEKRKEPSEAPPSDVVALSSKENEHHKHKRRKEDKEVKVKRKLDIDKVRKHRKKDKPKDEAMLSTLATLIVPEKEVPPTKLVYASSGLQLPLAELDRTSTIQVDEWHSLEVENGTMSEGCTISRIRYISDGEQTWENAVPHTIVAASGSGRITAVACDDQSVSVFSVSGRRLMPSLILESKISRLLTASHYVMVVTTQGSLYVWNCQTLTSVISKVSLTSIIPNDEVTLTDACLTDQGVPVITLSNNKSYTYSPGMAIWMLICDSEDIVESSSDHSSFTKGRTPVKGTLASVQVLKPRSSSQAMKLHRVNTGGQHCATVSHLENQVAAALAVQSAGEYWYWFLAYIRCLVHENMENKLREVCDDLLGPMYKSKTNQWSSFVLTLKKRDLLRDILPIIGSNLNLQRVFTEYHEQLDTITGNTS